MSFIGLHFKGDKMETKLAIRALKKKIRAKVRYLNTLSTHNFKIKEISDSFDTNGGYSFQLEGGTDRTLVWFEAKDFLHADAEKIWDTFKDEMWANIALEAWISKYNGD